MLLELWPYPSAPPLRMRQLISERRSVEEKWCWSFVNNSVAFCSCASEASIFFSPKKPPYIFVLLVKYTS